MCVCLCVWWNAFVEILIRFLMSCVWVCECVYTPFSNESVCLEFSKRSVRRQNHNSFVRSKFYAKKCCFVVWRLLYIFVVVVVMLSIHSKKVKASEEARLNARTAGCARVKKSERDQINKRQTIAPKMIFTWHFWCYKTAWHME